MSDSTRFWQYMDELVAKSKVVIDRPAHTAHPRYPDFIYPLDYGYLEGTTSGDKGGIDVWRGSLPEMKATAVICTMDLNKRDSEIKILLGCTPQEMQVILQTHNSCLQAGVLIKREEG